ncbi:ABC-2 family transporter protein [Clostridioides difficile]|nr:ABC-2 family transporter protein [Clostridioides difficile]
MFNSIYSHVDSIGGWQQGEMLIFIGTFSLINAINMTIFFLVFMIFHEKSKKEN